LQQRSCRGLFKKDDVLLGDLILSFAGKAYLLLRLRNKEQVQRELERKYEGRFRNAGLVLLFDVLMALAAAAIIGLIAAVLYFLLG